MNGDSPAHAEQKKTTKWSLLGVALVAVVGAAIAFVGIKKTQPSIGTRKGDAAPAFRLSRYGGGTVSLMDLRGKVVMLNFWATWCLPCAAEMPALTKLAREYEPKGFVFLAVNQEGEAAQEQVGLFISHISPDLDRSVVFADEETIVNYAVEDLPTSYFIGRDGRILESYAGYAPESLVRQKIESALGK